MPSNSPTSSSLQLWFARVGDLTTKLEAVTAQQLSPSEQKRLQATASRNKRREFLLSRALMRHALDQYFQPQKHCWQFIEQPNSPPKISNLADHIQISLTHSKSYICFAIATCAIGIDLEKLNVARNFPELAKAVMNEQELEYLQQHPDTLANNFYRIWCAKEAYYKALPIQQQSQLSLKDISIPALLDNTKKAISPTLITQQNSQLMLAIVMQTKPEQINYNHFPPDDRLMAEFIQSFAEPCSPEH